MFRLQVVKLPHHRCQFVFGHELVWVVFVLAAKIRKISASGFLPGAGKAPGSGGLNKTNGEVFGKSNERSSALVEDKAQTVAHVARKLAVGADKGDAVGHGLGYDEAVGRVAVVVVEGQRGIGGQMAFRHLLNVDTRFGKLLRPLDIGLTFTSASLAKCFAGVQKKLLFPLLE